MSCPDPVPAPELLARWDQLGFGAKRREVLELLGYPASYRLMKRGKHTYCIWTYHYPGGVGRLWWWTLQGWRHETSLFAAVSPAGELVVPPPEWDNFGFSRDDWSPALPE